VYPRGLSSLHGTTRACWSRRRSAVDKTVQIPGVPCSVTAQQALVTVNGTSTQRYGGGTSCAKAVGHRTLDVVSQVYNGTFNMWFSISLTALYQGPTPANPLRLSGSRTAVSTHTYRVLAYTQIALNDKIYGATACAGMCSGNPQLTMHESDIYVPFPATSTTIPGTACNVTAFGPNFALINNSYVLSYNAYVGCKSMNGVQARRLEIGAQVANGWPKTVYYTITGSILTGSSTASSGPALELYTGRTAYLGHGYRIFAMGSVTISGKTTSAKTTSQTSGP